MPIHLEWYDVALRLALTVFAGGLVGLNRTEHGQVAGLRTVILVCLAASVAMIQANLLMPTTGKAPESFVVLDLMRFPLGILTGIGFIGGGAILRKGEMVKGLTTAATLWLVTVMGLCFGGGQLGLGVAATAIALVVLWALKWLEHVIRQDQRAKLTLSAAADGPNEEEIRSALTAAGYRINSWDIIYKPRGHDRHYTLRCELSWHALPVDAPTPDVLERFKQRAGVLALRWSV